jgi:anti-sigma regulatory factor (Ser/Thr protein kinase)
VTERLEFSTVLDPDMSNVGTARRFVRTNLDQQAGSDVVADLQIIASELVTNAIEHGPHAPVRITVRVHGREVSVTVTSAGSAQSIAPTEAWQISDPDDLAGRGLGIVRALSDAVDVTTSGDQISITARRTTA